MPRSKRMFDSGGGSLSGGHAQMKDATELEEVVDAVKHINARVRREKREQQEKQRQPSLSPLLNDWLKKEIP